MNSTLKFLYVAALVLTTGAFALQTNASTTSVNFTDGSWLREDDPDTYYSLEASVRNIYDHGTDGYDSPILVHTTLPASLGTITAVTLRIYRDSLDPSEGPIAAYQTASFSGNVTWNTKPSQSDQIGNTISSGTNGSWYEYDAGEVYTWGSEVYVIFRSPSGTTGPMGVQFAGFANADQTLRPHVLIEYTAAATPTPTGAVTDNTPTTTVGALIALRDDARYYYFTTFFLVVLFGFFYATGIHKRK